MISKESLSILLNQALLVFFSLVAIIFLQFYTFLAMYGNLYNDYIDRLDTIYKVNNNVSLRDLCNSVSCISVLDKENKILYLNEAGRLYSSYTKLPSTETHFSYFTRELNTIIKYQEYRFFVDDSLLIMENVYSMVIVIAVCLFIIAVLLILYNRLSAKSKSLEYVTARRRLEAVAQRDITEILHHEMNLPMSVISIGVTNIKEQITNLRKVRKDEPELYTLRTSLIKELEGMLLAIDSINSVLKLLGNNKVIKKTNGNLSISTIIDRAILNCNTFNIGKISYTLENKDILTTNSIGGSLNNGELYNILKVLINNAIEAKATKLVFSAAYDKTQGFLNLFIQDNGPGIKDEYGRPLKNNNVIFDYGFSTKSRRTTEKVYNSFMSKIFSFFNLVNDDSYESGRGFGLYLNKKILESAKGTIYVGNSDRNGTLFVLVLPIKKTHLEE